MDNILVVVCARGGSKGIKGKNIRPLLNKPLISYSIKQALKWGRAKRVVVSTDSPDIARIARKYGAQIPFVRPKTLAGDTTPKVAVIRHALKESERRYKEKYNIVVDLDVTSPIRTIRDLDNCLRLFRASKPKTLFSVVKAHKNPYFNMVEQKGGRGVQLCKKLSRRPLRRQDVPAVYAMNASIYFYRRDFLLKSKSLSAISDNSAMYVMNDMAGVDIDREIDFKYIAFLVKEGVVKL